jgi:hypothetical protein
MPRKGLGSKGYVSTHQGSRDDGVGIRAHGHAGFIKFDTVRGREGPIYHVYETMFSIIVSGTR